MEYEVVGFNCLNIVLALWLRIFFSGGATQNDFHLLTFSHLEVGFLRISQEKFIGVGRALLRVNVVREDVNGSQLLLVIWLFLSLWSTKTMNTNLNEDSY